MAAMQEQEQAHQTQKQHEKMGLELFGCVAMLWFVCVGASGLCVMWVDQDHKACGLDGTVSRYACHYVGHE